MFFFGLRHSFVYSRVHFLSRLRGAMCAERLSSTEASEKRTSDFTLKYWKKEPNVKCRCVRSFCSKFGVNSIRRVYCVREHWIRHQHRECTVTDSQLVKLALFGLERGETAKLFPLLAASTRTINLKHSVSVFLFCILLCCNKKS